MNNNSDPLYNQYADMDFGDAKPLIRVAVMNWPIWGATLIVPPNN